MYEDDVFSPRTPIYADGQNNFTSYFFVDTQKVAVGASFFVGWRQLDAERLNLGFDRNIDKSNEILYSVDGGGNWLVCPFQGSAMLRPIFSTGMDVYLGIENIVEETNELIIYPNPAQEIIHLKGDLNLMGRKKILLDSFGRILKETSSNSFDLSGLNAAIYFIHVPELSPNYYKVIKH